MNSIRQLAHGGQQQNLNLEMVRNLPIPIPPDKDLQSEVVDILDAIDCKIGLHQRKRAVLGDLFKTLLHKLMTGEIRVGIWICARGTPRITADAISREDYPGCFHEPER